MDARSLCRYTCCNKACDRDVRDVNAWQLLANMHVPRAARDVLNSDAVSRMQSHVRRRLLADDLAKSSLSTTQTFRPNEWADFTYFVRLTVGNEPFPRHGVVVWEGDVRPQARRTGELHLPLTLVWSELKDAYPNIAKKLAVVPVPSADYSSHPGLARLMITVIAIRDSDQAMVPLGHFEYGDCIGNAGEMDQEHYFSASDYFTLYHTPRMEFRPIIFLGLVHDTSGGGMFDFLVLDMEHHYGDDYEEEYDETYICHMENDNIRHVLTYVAGVPDPRLRGPAMCTMEDWHDSAMVGAE